MTKVDVIIPVIQPSKKLFLLLDALADQTVVPAKVYLLNVENGDSENDSTTLQSKIYRYFGKRKLFGHKLPLQLEIISVKDTDFDEGATRNLGVARSTSPFFLFMKQDTVIADNKLIEELLWSMEGGAGLAFARHITNSETEVLSAYTTMLRYPSKSKTITEENKTTQDICHTFNVCAMYRRDVFLQQGGFAKKIVAGEDILFVAQLLRNGGKIEYCAEAKVYYKETEHWPTLLRQNFDYAVTYAQHSKILGDCSVVPEDVRYAKEIISYLYNQKYYFEILDFIGENVHKWIGRFLGRQYRFFKPEWILKLTANRNYWEN